MTTKKFHEIRCWFILAAYNEEGDPNYILEQFVCLFVWNPKLVQPSFTPRNFRVNPRCSMYGAIYLHVSKGDFLQGYFGGGEPSLKPYLYSLYEGESFFWMVPTTCLVNQQWRNSPTTRFDFPWWWVKKSSQNLHFGWYQRTVWWPNKMEPKVTSYDRSGAQIPWGVTWHGGGWGVGPLRFPCLVRSLTSLYWSNRWTFWFLPRALDWRDGFEPAWPSWDPDPWRIRF